MKSKERNIPGKEIEEEEGGKREGRRKRWDWEERLMKGWSMRVCSVERKGREWRAFKREEEEEADRNDFSIDSR